MANFSKRLLSFALCAVLVFSALPVVAADKGITLRVEGAEGNIVYETNVPFEGQTALELLTSVLDEKGISYTAEGGYLSEVGGEQDGAFGGWDGWVYYVNGFEGATAIGECQLAAGDSLLIAYCDPYDAENPTLIPQIAVETDEGGAAVLAITAELTTFDADWNMTVTTVPVEGATVTVDGSNYISDQDGIVTLTSSDAAKAKISVQINKYAENGKPLVVRFAPDFTLALSNVISFSDVSAGAWYEQYVIQLVALGAVNGYDDGTFRPLNQITRAEYIKILACLDPEFDIDIKFTSVFSDVRRADWFMPYIMWAIDKGVIEKASVFNPNTALTREDMALFVYNFAVNVLEKPLPNGESANAFDDEAQISDHCREAIYLLQKAGIINGIEMDGGVIYSPKGSAQRSQAAKVIAMVVNLPSAQ